MKRLIWVTVTDLTGTVRGGRKCRTSARQFERQAEPVSQIPDLMTDGGGYVPGERLVLVDGVNP